MLALERVGPYMQSKQAHIIDDWSTISVDEEGKAIQEGMTAKFQVYIMFQEIRDNR
jgi:exportin-5